PSFLEKKQKHWQLASQSYLFCFFSEKKEAAGGYAPRRISRAAFFQVPATRRDSENAGRADCGQQPEMVVRSETLGNSVQLARDCGPSQSSQLGVCLFRKAAVRALFDMPFVSDPPRCAQPSAKS